MAKAPHDDLPFTEFQHPNDASEVAALITQARAHGRKVRVRGSLHSERGSVLSEATDGVQIMLDRLTEVTIGANGMVVAEAGVSLGGDPMAPRGRYNPQFHPDQSPFDTLFLKGLAMPITGGISHQTLSGFVSTGADGGSTRYSFQSAISALTLVDGAGREIRLERNGLPHVDGLTFEAALASLGLFGVLVSVELMCEPALFVTDYWRGHLGIGPKDV